MVELRRNPQCGLMITKVNKFLTNISIFFDNQLRLNLHMKNQIMVEIISYIFIQQQYTVFDFTYNGYFVNEIKSL